MLQGDRVPCLGLPAGEGSWRGEAGRGWPLSPSCPSSEGPAGALGAAAWVSPVTWQRAGALEWRPEHSPNALYDPGAFCLY